MTLPRWFILVLSSALGCLTLLSLSGNAVEAVTVRIQSLDPRFDRLPDSRLAPRST